MEKLFIGISEETEKVIVNSIDIYNNLKLIELKGNKRIEFTDDVELVSLDEEDLIVISLLLGILNSASSVTRILNDQYITREIVLKYLGLSEMPINNNENTQYDGAHIYLLTSIANSSSNNGRPLTLELIAYSLYRNFICGSDIIANLYYAEISRDRNIFNMSKGILEGAYESRKDGLINKKDPLYKRVKFIFQPVKGIANF
jgi:hypothetical protein